MIDETMYKYLKSYVNKLKIYSRYKFSTKKIRIGFDQFQKI